MRRSLPFWLGAIVGLFGLWLMGHTATTIIPGPGANLSVNAGGNPSDDFESYSDAAVLDTLNGGSLWAGAYSDKTSSLGIQSSDDFESYSDAATVNSLNGGLAWGGSYADADNPLGIKSTDDMESYSDAASVNSLNGGTGWSGAFTDR